MTFEELINLIDIEDIRKHIKVVTVTYNPECIKDFNPYEWYAIRYETVNTICAVEFNCPKRLKILETRMQN